MKLPERTSDKHALEQFDCGYEALNYWLKRKSLKNECSHDSRTYVICNAQKVIGCYSIATGRVEHFEAISTLKRNAPNPISVMVLGRLAMDKKIKNLDSEKRF